MKSWAGAAALLFGTSVMAQSEPNDIELRAAYCVPVVKSTIRLVNDSAGKLVGSTNAVDVRALAELTEYRQKLDSDLKRLQAYVLPKVSGDRGDDFVLGLAAADRRGSADMERLPTAAASCVEICPGGDSQCLQACADREPVFRRVQQCHSLDWLPF